MSVSIRSSGIEHRYPHNQPSIPLRLHCLLGQTLCVGRRPRPRWLHVHSARRACDEQGVLKCPTSIAQVEVRAHVSYASSAKSWHSNSSPPVHPLDAAFTTVEDLLVIYRQLPLNIRVDAVFSRCVKGRKPLYACENSSVPESRSSSSMVWSLEFLVPFLPSEHHLAREVWFARFRLENCC